MKSPDEMYFFMDEENDFDLKSQKSWYVLFAENCKLFVKEKGSISSLERKILQAGTKFFFFF